MKVAIIQPYFFPYLGYYQIINAVDTFVIYDDVNYIKKGWINRNRILLNNNQDKLITLSLNKASQNKLINEIDILDNKQSLLSLIQSTYHKAAYRNEIVGFLQDCFSNEEINLSQFLADALKKTCSLLSMDTDIVLSSQLPNDKNLKGEEKIIDICEALGASQYMNPIGGQSLYSEERFAQHNLDLKFHNFIPVEYEQHQKGAVFFSHLSIIDALMFSGIEGVKRQLTSYELL